MQTATETDQRSSLLGDGARYTVAGGGASVLDLSTAWAAHALIQLPLMLSAGLGVIVGGLAAYGLLEFWAFRRADSAFSAKRLAGLFGLVALTLILRTAFVGALAHVFPMAWAALPILASAFALTFCVNFAVNRLVIFRASPAHDTLRQT